MRVDGDHNSTAHPSAHGPPRGLCRAIRRETNQATQLPLLQAIQLVKQRRVRLLKRLLKRRAVQRRLRLVIRVAMQVAIQVRTQAPTQRTTRFGIRSDEHRAILRETEGILDLRFPIDDWRTADSEIRIAGYGSRLAGCEWRVRRGRPRSKRSRPRRQGRQGEIGKGYLKRKAPKPASR
jgi:hypothetical protein